MKTILAGLILLAASAVQAQVFYLPNRGGGEIVLTARACIVNGQNYPGAREAYTWTPNSRKQQACWEIIDGNVHVIYIDTRQIHVYRIEEFQRKE